MKGENKLMKAFLPAAVVLLAILPSCNNLGIVEDYSCDETQEVAVIARMEQTKTSNVGNSTVWLADDVISVIIRNSGTETCYNKRFTYDVSSGTFKGQVNRNERTEYNDWFAVYPYREENTDPASISLTIPATQTQIGYSSKSHFAGEGFPLFGKVESLPRASNTPEIQMNQVLAGAQFNFTNNATVPVIVKEIVFTTSHPISGDFSADITGDGIVITPDGLTSESSTLKVEDGTALAVGGTATFSLGVIPFTAESTEQIKVKVTAVNPNTQQEIVYYHVYEIPAGTKFTDGHIKTITVNFDDAHQSDPEGTEKSAQTLSFANSQINWTIGSDCQIGGSYAPQNPSGALTPITYSSDNEQVATILDGKIVIKGAGSTSITATAAENEYYYSASASYTLVVAEAPVTVQGYTRITSEPTDWSGTYIFTDVNGKYIFTGADSENNIYATTSADFSGNDIVKDCSAYEFTITKSGSSYYLKHDGKYIYCDEDYSTDNLGMGYSSSEKALSFTTMNDNTFSFYMYDNTSRKNQYLYFKTSGSNGFFKFGGSHNNIGVRIYKKTGSVTPVDPSTKSFVKVTSTPTSWDGTYLIVDENSGKAFAFDKSGYTVSVNITNGTIAYTSETEKYAVTVSDAGTKHANNTSYEAYDVLTSTGKYIYCSGSEIQIADTNAKTESSGSYHGGSSTTYYYYHTFMYDNGVQMMSGRNSSGSSKYYMGYSSNKFAYSNSTSNRVQLYKLSGSVAPQPEIKDQTLSFASSQIEWTIGSECQVGGSYEPQAVSGAKTAVSWSSSNEKVATISNGMIVIKGAGTTTITATAQSSSEYKAASASYTLVVAEAPVTVQGYTRITSEPTDWSGTYIFTDANGKYIFTGADSKNNIYTTTSADFSGNDIVKDCSAYEFTITKSGSSYYLKHDGKYIYCTEQYSSSNDLGMGYSSSEKALSFTTMNDNTFSFYMYDNNNRKDQYLYFKTSGSNGYFKFGGSHNNIGVRIYKKTGPVTPQPGKENQTLNFASSSINWAIGDYYKVGSSYPIQTLTGAQTTVSYTSSNTSVATISNGQIMIAGPGSTVITATAAANDVYNSASASYTLVITQEGAYNIENDYLAEYLDAAERTYTNSSTSSIVTQYIGSSSGSGSYWGGVAHDLPKPVSLAWTGNATSISIYEGTSTTGTAVKTMNFSSSSSVDVYNLIPGKNYAYKTSNGQTGTFSVTGRRRMIKVSDSESENHARNCRDFGGVKTRNNQTLKFGLMYRGTNIDSVTEGEKSILVNELGIKLDQDLRNETSKTSSPLGSSVEFCHHGGYDAGSIANENGTKMTQSVEHVLDAVIENRPVYIHCRIGSDRTGHMCMLYLALLGCDLKECDIDYEITSFASKMTGGTRTLNSGNEKSFRNKFIKSPYNANQVPEAVEEYVTKTLGISIDKVKAFRKAMGVNETL